MWWQAMLWGMLGGGVFRVGFNLTKWAVMSALEARLDSKREEVAQLAVSDPEALAERLGLPVEVIKRYGEGQRIRDQLPGNGYSPQ